MTTDTASYQGVLTSQTWKGHWHGYGPWIGSPTRYFMEGHRRPPHPDVPPPGVDHYQRYHDAASSFATSNLPPLMTGHWLMKQGQTSHERTWTNLVDTIEWMKKHYTDTPPLDRPDGQRTYVELDTKIAYVYDVLPRGVDVSWVYYTQSRSLLSLSVVCCPNLFHQQLPCPLLPT